MLQEKGLVQVRRGLGHHRDAAGDVEHARRARARGEHRRGRTGSTCSTTSSSPAGCSSPTWPTSRPARPTRRSSQQLQRLVATMDELVDDPIAYADQDRAFHDTIMRTSGNRIARAVVRALESQVVNTARYMGEIRRDLCVASNHGHRNIYLRIAAHDPDGAAKAMFTHITEAWVVRRGGSGEPVRLRR